MRDDYITQLEIQLEKLIEGAFTQVFGKRLNAQDIALQLAREMESGLLAIPNAQAVAPDNYEILLNPQTLQSLAQQQPNLAAHLGQHLLELAATAGYRMQHIPSVKFIPEPALMGNASRVVAYHNNDALQKTHTLQPVHIPKADQHPDAQLLLHDQIIPLTKPLLNIGRGLDNDIVLQDAHSSRQHGQIRLRFGRFTLFDTDSRTGTFVNETQVREHILVSGDVIRMGKTRLVYLEDQPAKDSTTQMPPVVS
ncbi:MAG: FhaA domain-containing protein [Phototrophicaceae bacterium]|jgi:hypothetical protein